MSPIRETLLSHVKSSVNFDFLVLTIGPFCAVRYGLDNFLPLLVPSLSSLPYLCDDV